MFDILALPNPAKYSASGFGWYVPTLASLEADTATTAVNETLTYGNPFPSPTYGAAFDARVNYDVPFTAPATAACPTPAAGNLTIYYRRSGPLSDLSSPVTARLGLVTGLTVTPLAATPAGVPVQVSWTAPAAGPLLPDRYRVRVYRISVDASCKTTIINRGSIWVPASQNSVVYRPSYFVSGGTYVAEVRALLMPEEPADLSKPNMFYSSNRVEGSIALGSTFTR
jgi:hypothetical protein